MTSYCLMPRQRRAKPCPASRRVMAGGALICSDTNLLFEWAYIVETRCVNFQCKSRPHHRGLFFLVYIVNAAAYLSVNKLYIKHQLFMFCDLPSAEHAESQHESQ